MNINKQDLEDMSLVLYHYYKSIKDNKAEPLENVDIDRIIELKRKLNILIIEDNKIIVKD